MSEDQESYRPRSPDLSEFVPRQPSLAHLPSFHPSESSFPPGYAFSPRGSYDASPYFSPQTIQGSYFGAQPQSQSSQTYTSPKNSRIASVPSIPQHHFPPPRQAFSQDQAQARHPPPPAFNTPTYSSPASYQPPQSSPFNPPPHATDPTMPRTRGKRPPTYFEGDDGDDAYDPDTSATAAPPRPAPPSAPLAMPADTSNLELTIDVKTKFPVARIKRIMQSDEDVGKVAQATPTAIAKALELFMITLVTKGAAEARQSNTKRITAQHLKTALMADPQFDFLSEQCANIPDESSGGGGSKKSRGKSEAKSEDSDEDMGGTTTSVGAGRKKGKKDD